MTTIRCLWLTKGLGRGGVERLLVDMAALIDRDAFEVDVAYVLPWKDDHRDELVKHGLDVSCLADGDRQWIRELRHRIRDRRYDVVHSHAPVPGSAARLVAGRKGPALIHTEHNVWDRYRLPTRILNSVTFHRNRAAVAVSDTVARSMQPMWAARAPEITTIHHGTVLGSIQHCPPEERTGRREAVGLPTDRFLIGTVGNMTPKKNQRALLEALDHDGAIAKAHLVMIGHGPLADELRGHADALGVSDRVTFLGSRNDVFELLPLFDVFCLSSQFEGFPISLVEAMATGLPCVATAVGGIPEILVDDTNGLLVPSDSVPELRRALERVMEEDGLAARLARRAKEDSNQLDLRTAVRRLEELYRQAVAAGPS